MNKIKRIVAALAAAATVSTLGICAYAEADPNPDNWFSFMLSGQGKSDWSAKAEKENDDDEGYVLTKTGSVSATSPIYVTIYKERSVSSSNVLSKTVTVTDPSELYKIEYTTHRGTGSINYLRGACGYNGAQITGYWQP